MDVVLNIYVDGLRDFDTAAFMKMERPRAYSNTFTRLWFLRKINQILN